MMLRADHRTDLHKYAAILSTVRSSREYSRVLLASIYVLSVRCTATKVGADAEGRKEREGREADEAPHFATPQPHPKLRTAHNADTSTVGDDASLEVEPFAIFR